MKILHTADWQLGRRFKNLPTGVGERLALARFDVIDTIAALARAQRIEHVLVAGDLFDGHRIDDGDVARGMQRMAAAAGVRWWVLPGNHDSLVGGGIWDRVRASSMPPNVVLMDSARPFDAGDGLFLLPAPLTHTSTYRDLTAWWDDAQTPDARYRIGVAHGSVRQFGSGDQGAKNPVDPGRRVTAHLDYLALGDWHGAQEVQAGVWYAGTPEIDRFGEQSIGKVVVVDLAPRPAAAWLHTVGQHRWIDMAFTLDDLDGVDRLVRALDEAGFDNRSVVQLTLEGGLEGEGVRRLDARLDEIAARVMHLSVRRDALREAAALDDLEALPAGILRDLGNGLLAEAANDDVSRRALRLLLNEAAGMGR
jgi:DNA repair exonuclease SbcCD nuclease subunit